MRVRIHRGAHEIGGSCVEVESGDRRIVLDVGRPLSAGRDEVVPLPDIPGLARGDPALLGVVISHAHQDHWGLAGQVPPGVPIYMGEATHRILNEAAFWTVGLTTEPAGFLRHRQPFELGPFRITPFLNDHSAFDAYSLLVEAGDRRLFYTGDIRGHGRKAGIFEELLRKPPANIDVLLMEGTNIGNEPDEAPSPRTEADVEDRCVEVFKSTAGLALVLFSAQNVDRLVTLYRAALRSDRDFVMDLYTASIAIATGNPNIPHPSEEWPHVRVLVPRWQRVKVKETRTFTRVEAIKPYRLFDEDFASAPERYVLKADVSALPALARAGCLSGAVAVWSMWSGYLTEGSGARLQAMLAEHGVPLTVEHTSGHASVADLQRLAAPSIRRRSSRSTRSERTASLISSTG